MGMGRIPFFLVALMLGMVFTPIGNAAALAESETVDIVVATGPNGISTQAHIDVPNNHVVNEIELELEPKVWPINRAFSWKNQIDFEHSDATFDGIDVNLSEGMSLLPDGFSDNFESGNLQSHWTTSGSSSWNVQSSNAISGTYSAKAGGITHGQSTALEVQVSTPFAVDGFFDYKVSSENNYDYLIFCIDNTACSRYSNYQMRWSGINSGTHSFTAAAGTHTYTWKYEKDGSVNSNSDTAWIDNVIIIPQNGVGNGEGNWTSPAFGPEGHSDFKTNIDRYGLMSLDAEIPMGAEFSWTIVDGSTFDSIPGYVERTDMKFDLAGIDTDEHRSLRIRIDLGASENGSPIIYGLHMEGQIQESFNNDPILEGWSLNGATYSGGKISGGPSDSIISPAWGFNSPIGRLKPYLDFSGQGELSYLDADGQWEPLELNRTRTLSEPMGELKFKWTGSSTWKVDGFRVELDDHQTPMNPRIDVGVDGILEWSMADESLQSWGFQTIFTDGENSKNLLLGTSLEQKISFLAPNNELNGLSFTLSPLDVAVSNLDVVFKIDGNEVLQKLVGTVSQATWVQLSESELDIIDQRIEASSNKKMIGGSYFKEVEVVVTGSPGPMLVSGLSVIWHNKIVISGGVNDLITRSINTMLPSVSSNQGTKEVQLPVLMDRSSSISMTLKSVDFSPSPPSSTVTLNQSLSTLTASDDWVEVTSSLDLSSLGISDIETHLNQQNWAAYLFVDGTYHSEDVICMVKSSADKEDCQFSGLIDLAEYSLVVDGQIIHFFHKLMIDASWPSEPSLRLSLSINMDGVFSVPGEYLLGLGSQLGVQQSLSVVAWGVLSENGMRSHPESAYFNQDGNSSVFVQLTFEGLESSPRSGDVMIKAYQDGVLVGETDVCENGLYHFPISFETGVTQSRIHIEIIPLANQPFTAYDPMLADFVLDETPPELISSSLKPLHHVSQGQDVQGIFVISDRPILPLHAKAFLRDSRDGTISQRNLEIPSDIYSPYGEYKLDLKMDGYAVGDFIEGWLEISDPAGHMVQNTGNASHPMFVISLEEDQPSSFDVQKVAWEHDFSGWLHPEEVYTLQIELSDNNGIGDVKEVTLNLDADENSEDILITWQQQDNSCTSSDSSVILIHCGLPENSTIFDTELFLEFKIKFEWNFNPDPSIYRHAFISLEDHSGQLFQSSVPQLTWRFSSEFYVDVENSEISNASLWVQPYANHSLIVELFWFRDHSFMKSELSVQLEIGLQKFYSVASEGRVDIPFITPSEEGIFDLMVKGRNLPEGAVERTQDFNQILIVDSTSPKVVRENIIHGLTSPAMDEIVPEWLWTNITLEFEIDEFQGINISSMTLHWSINKVGVQAFPIHSGNTSVKFSSAITKGERIPMNAIVNLGDVIPANARMNAFELRVWVTGKDIAGNDLEAASNNELTPLGIVALENRESHISFSSVPIHIDPADNLLTEMNAEIRFDVVNTGMADGESRVKVEVVNAEGEKTELGVYNIQVRANSSNNITFDWTPNSEGTYWFEFTLLSGEVMISDTVQVIQSGDAFISQTYQKADGISLSFVSFVILLLLILMISMLRKPRNHDFENDELR